MNNISTIADNLHIQDGRMTSLPIFLVQEKHRVCGLDEEYSSDYVWVNENSEEVTNEMSLLLDEADRLDLEEIVDPDDLEGDKLDKNDYRKGYYRDEYVFVQPFFTEHGAQEYIKANGHNLREPQIYVESGYRNKEWELVREYLMDLKKEGRKS